MLRSFKFLPLNNRLIIGLWLAFASVPTFGQQLVYDLRQDWVFFNEESQSFLPVEDQNLSLKTISFRLRDSEFNQFYLTILLKKKAHLFYRTKLIATLPAGSTSLKIDSLRRELGDLQPMLTIFGDNLLPELSVRVMTKSIPNNRPPSYQPIRYANDFSNFFYLILTLIVGFFVVLKTRFPELTDQYLLFYRAIRMKTLDELIYKINFIAYPNILFIAFIGMVFAFVVMSFMYFFPGIISILDINPGVIPFWRLVLGWTEISVLVGVLLVLKFFLTLLASSIFSLKTASVHFASFLRLAMVLALSLLLLIIIQQTMLGELPQFIYWGILLGGLLGIEIILYLKLTIGTSHTLLYIILYLCATEIIPIILLLKFITE